MGATRPVVSIVKIANDNIPYAVEKAIDLIGGIAEVTKGKSSIMIKPNLVGDAAKHTTKPTVVKALAQLMQGAGKTVLCGEGSVGAAGITHIDGSDVRTKKTHILTALQKQVYDKLGYTALGQQLGIQLVNLHTGNIVQLQVPGATVFKDIYLHKSLIDVDLLCSVPMMKTHGLGMVTLGMKNLIGCYPGEVYYNARKPVHTLGEDKGSPGAAYEIVDMVRANKLGLVVIDGSMAMEGNGPVKGTLVKMDVIIAGTNPLATDMVGAAVMGIQPWEVPTFVTAQATGMTPTSLAEIQIVGEKISAVTKKFVRPSIYTWSAVKGTWATEEI
jgi:uncharacterized protein (DUF362 family)